MPATSTRTLDRHFVRYGLAFVQVGLAYLLRESLVRYFGLELPPFITFYPAILATAMLAGVWPGILATGLVVAIVDSTTMGHIGRFDVARPSGIATLVLFTLMGLFVSIAAEQYRRMVRRVRLDDALRNSERKYRALTESINDIFISFDREMRITYWNKRAEEFTGLSSQHVLGKTRLELRPDSEQAEKLDEVCREALRLQRPVMCENEWTHEGTNYLLEARYFPNEFGVTAILRDITEQKKREVHIERLNRVYAVLSDINQTIVREKDSIEMMEAACRTAVEKGKFCMAWIGMADPETNVLEPVASWGVVDGYLDTVHIDLKEAAHADGPASRCFSSGEHQLRKDIEHDPGYAPWREEALKRGYRSTGAFPLSCDGKVIGVLSLYAQERGFFEKGEIDLLDEMAMDISFALEVNRNEMGRRKAEAELERKTAFFEALVESSQDGVLVVNREGRKVLQNSRLEELLEIPPEVALDVDDARQLSHTASVVKNPDVFLEKVLDLYSQPDALSHDEVELVSGRVMDRHSSPVKDRAGTYYGRIWSFRDITDRKRNEEALRESLESLREAQSIGELGSYVVDLRTETWRGSEVLNQIYGIEDTGDHTVDDWIALVRPCDRDLMTNYFLNEVVGKRKPFNKEYRIVRRSDGAERWVHGLGRLDYDANGDPLRMRGVIRDISEQRKAQEALRDSERLYRTAFQTNPDLITVTRLNDGKYLDVNTAALEVFGFTREEAVGSSSLELNIWVDLRDRATMLDVLKRDTVCRNMEVRLRKKNKETFWALVSAAVVEHNGVACMYAITRDISDAKRAESRIKHLAFYDSLTGLPNRLLLLDRLERALTANTRDRLIRALLFIDLDNFKTLNDTYGHDVGDLQLQEVARRLAGCIRERDTVARLGGDEFVVMLEGLSENAEEAAAFAQGIGEKILEATSQPYLLNDREHHSTVSIGINVFGDQRESLNEVMKQADIAMYQAKSAGRNTMRFFAPSLQAAVNSRARLEEELRRALRNGQFELYYQPQLDGNHVIGAEALLRWVHPERGVLSPIEFIALTEETGLIVPLGEWALQSACEAIAPWSHCKSMAQLTVAVNISARQLRQPDFVDKVLTIIEKAGANPRNLKLELTESMLLENVEDVIAKMTELRDHGLSFSVDDFGTGYSSLSYLKRLPLSQLKIDRSFVRDILTDAGSSAIARSIITMSQAMGMSVIAEGVETEEQRLWLAKLGCHMYQGYLFSRPVPWEQLQQFLPGRVAATQAV